MELIRPIVRVGNSAGVVLPREWLHGKAKVTLVEKPADVKRELMEILDEYLESVIGIALVGSYARGEETAESDVDVLVITQNVGNRIRYGKYEILLIPVDEIKKRINRNALPLIPMFREAKPLMNKALFDIYKNEKITMKNLQAHIETTKSALAVVRELLNLLDENETCVSDGVMYSLVLRLREWQIVEHLLHKTTMRKNKFLELIKRVSGSQEPYFSYLRSKNNKKEEKKTSAESALKIYYYLLKKIGEQEIWIRKKG